MVVFHSYVSLPEGTTCSPASRRSLGPERHVVYRVSLKDHAVQSQDVWLLGSHPEDIHDLFSVLGIS